MLSLLFTYLSLCLTVTAARNSFIVHERRDVDTHHPWSQRESADEELVVRTRIALTQRNLENGHDWLMEVSDPYSESYGKHYRADQVVNLFAPSHNAIQSVAKWLHNENIGNISLSGNKQWLVFDTNVAILQQLLDTTYYEYENMQTGKLTIGCESYFIPAHLQDHIEFISPGLTMAETLHPNLAKTKRNAEQGGGVNKHVRLVSASANTQSAATDEINCGTITPQCIKQLYHINDNVTHTAHDGNSIGVYENGGLYLSQDDLDTFLQTYEPSFPPNLYPNVNRVDGAPNPKTQGVNSPGIESSNDFDVIYPLVYPIPIELFQVDDLHWEIDEPTGLFDTFLDYLDGSFCNKTAFGITGDSPQYDPVYPDNITEDPDGPPWMHPVQCGITNPPRVISISYSFGEADVSAAYARRQCQEFMKLGMQGVTIFGASGDTGVGNASGSCIGDGGQAFAPYGLTNCPYVTAVGSTTLPAGAVAGKNPEVATHSIGSSGGFSNVFTVPKYQERALATYFADHNPPYPSYMTSNNPTASNVTGRYNRNGRGIPDVAAIGEDIIIQFFGSSFTSEGTSLSAPVWAGIIARINGARAAQGKGGVGFLNPVLYAHPEVFTDIVSGNNSACGTTGFSCVAGWDPVTGLGTPVYPALKELLLQL